MCKPRVMGRIGEISKFMSSLVTEKCPHCGNVVEGKAVKSYTNTVACQGAKRTAIDPMVLSGVVGRALSFIGSAMSKQKVNKNIDKLDDKLEEEFLSMIYEFECPSCHHKWTREDTEASSSSSSTSTSATSYTSGSSSTSSSTTSTSSTTSAS